MESCFGAASPGSLLEGGFYTLRSLVDSLAEVVVVGQSVRHLVAVVVVDTVRFVAVVRMAYLLVEVGRGYSVVAKSTVPVEPGKPLKLGSVNRNVTQRGNQGQRAYRLPVGKGSS